MVFQSSKRDQAQQLEQEASNLREKALYEEEAMQKAQFTQQQQIQTEAENMKRKAETESAKEEIQETADRQKQNVQQTGSKGIF